MRKECRHSILLTYHYPDLVSASDWLKICSNQEHLGSDTSSVWNFCTVPQTSILMETSGGFTKMSIGFFSQAMLILDKNLQNVVSLTPFRIAELVERENEAYHKLDPDPFDDRHPGNIYVAVNFCFSFVLNSLAYTTTPKNNEKIKIN